MQPECPNFSVRRTRARVAWRLGGAVLCGVAAAIVVAVACKPQRTAGPPAKRFAGKTVRIAAPNDTLLRALILRQGGSWAEANGATMEIENADSTQADVFLFSPYELARLHGLGLLQPLPTNALNASTFEIGSILWPQRIRLAEWQTTTYAIPFAGDAMVAVYRHDLLDDPVHRKAVNSKLKTPLRSDGPLTWQEVLAIAEYFGSISKWSDGNEKATPRTSLAPVPADADAFDREFHAVAASFIRRATTQEQVERLSPSDKQRQLYDYLLDAQSGEPRIADGGFVAALGFLQQLQRFRPKGAADRPSDTFRNGQAVFAVVNLAEVSRLQAKDSPVRDSFSVCRIPGSDTIYASSGNPVPAMGSERNFIPYLGAGGWMGSLSSKASEKEAALDFLLSLGGPPTSLEIVFEPAWGAGPTRLVQFEITRRAGWHTYGLDTARTNQLVSALERTSNPQIVNPVYRLRIPNQQAYFKAFVDGVQPAVLQGTKPADALQEVANQWNKIDPNPQNRRTQYRRSLGLE